jgi:NADPH-dependent glutamate synthase beta subunit-like oxidoreductase
VPPAPGRRVAVYGGGNTALDAARTALRLGAGEVHIVYRRTRAKMPAHGFEVDEALEEGVVLHELRTIRRFDNGRLTLETMTLDETGWPRPTGAGESLGIDTVILALGQEVDASLVANLDDVVVNHDGTVAVDADCRTGHRLLFAGGDMVPGEHTVTVAIGHGKRAAQAIDAGLRENTPRPEPAAPGTASFDRLHLWYYDRSPPAAVPPGAPAARRRSFAEVAAGLDEAAATQEAARCLSCGDCLQCDNCVVLCPYHAVSRRGEGFAIDRGACTLCGLCVAECPCGALQMVADNGAIVS